MLNEDDDYRRLKARLDQMTPEELKEHCRWEIINATVLFGVCFIPCLVWIAYVLFVRWTR